MLLQKLGMDTIGASGVSDLLAPMPGLVLSAAVSAGDTVKKDDPLVVLEAMKMENVLKSPIDGVIKEVSVNSGDTVEKNQTLIIFES
jgi:biotin carboxyl carrier protein